MWAIPYSNEYQKGGLASPWAFFAEAWAVAFLDWEGKAVGMRPLNLVMKSVKFF